jgi:DMSO reductase anchor subunit
METQWELILFTTFTAWSAGLFGAQALAAAFGQAKKAQLISWIVAAVLLVIGGIAVFLHLQHWERIFNGFGHLTSSITQEFIALVVFAVVAIIYIIFLRRSEDGGSVPKWLAWLAVILAVAVVFVVAHSYLVGARPAWNSYLWVAYVLGNALVLGPATLAVIMALKGEDAFKQVGMWVLVGALINLICAVAYAIFLQMIGGSFTDVGLYFDPNHPTKAVTDVNAIVSAQAVLLWLGAVVIGAAIPAIAAFVARRSNNAASWKIWGIAIILCAIIGALIMRVVFYALGLSVFMFY